MAHGDIDPSDIDPDTGRPYASYSSPALDTSMDDAEFELLGEDDGYPPPCTDPRGHSWPTVEEYERCLCIHCGADGDA